MAATGESLGDYRARAAACRAMADKAAEFPSEARTWVQIAEMWEGLAERAEAPPPEGTADISTEEPAADRDAVEAPPAPNPVVPPPTPALEDAPVAAPQRSPLRRAAVIAGFLLLPVLALAAFWPASNKPKATVVAERAAPAPVPVRQITAPPAPAPVAPPSPASTAPSSASAEPAAAPARVAEAPPVAPPAPPPPAPTPPAPAPQPAPERVAAAPAPPPAAAPAIPLAAATPEPPAAAPAAAPAVAAAPPTVDPLSETGSVGQRPEPAPEVPAAAPPSAAPPPPQRVAALPKAPRVSARPEPEPDPEPAPARQKLTGTWWPTACPKPKERKTAVPMVLGEDRAKAGAASCTFLKKAHSGAAWKVVAKCSDGTSSWTANIRLVLEGKRLQWASERGTQTYRRCG